MRDIKTRPTDRMRHVMTNAVRAPKELRRSVLSAKEKAQETAAPQQRDESPTAYAESRLERTGKDLAYRTGEEAVHRGKQLSSKASGTQKQYREVRHRGTEQNRSSFRTESNAVQQGRERVRQTAQSSSRMQQASQQAVRQSGDMAKTITKSTVKIAQQSVKTAEKSVKVMQQSANTAHQATQAAVKAAQAAKDSAKAVAAAGKSAAKTISAAVKWIIAAVKSLVEAIAAGGWVAVAAVVIIVLIVALVSLFGIFAANGDGKDMTLAIEEINTEFQENIQRSIDALTLQAQADAVNVIYDGDCDGLITNWPDVLGIYSILLGFNEDNPADVTVVDAANKAKLKEVFDSMNTASFDTEMETAEEILRDEYGAVILDSNGDPKVSSATTLIVHVNIASMGYREAAEQFTFTTSQDEMLTELMKPEFYPMFAELLGDAVGDGGIYGSGLEINPDLPNSELGAQIVQAAKKYIGRSYSNMDCSKFVRTVYADCGLNSMSGLTSTGMAEKCRDMDVLFTDASQLQAGDLIFFGRFDPGRGPEYCGDTRRCGSGKCRRWQHIHHVAIYINDDFLIDSTKKGVQIQKHWGQNGSQWKWVCYGRPAN